MAENPVDEYRPIPFELLSPELQREVVKTKRTILAVGVVSIGSIVLMIVGTVILALFV